MWRGSAGAQPVDASPGAPSGALRAAVLRVPGVRDLSMHGHACAAVFVRAAWQGVKFLWALAAKAGSKRVGRPELEGLSHVCGSLYNVLSVSGNKCSSRKCGMKCCD